jgi:hypothetical protein
MGTAVFWGMLFATLAGVFIIPGLYVFTEKLSRKGRKVPQELPPPTPAPERGH